MASIKFSLMLVMCLVALSRSAPTETETSTAEALPQAQDAPSSTPVPESSSPGASTEAASSPTTTAVVDSSTTQAPAMAVASAQENHSKLTNTSFTCYGRTVGYYADVDLACKVYHFCLPGDYNGEPVFQRISYLCLNETTFDQQALDCVVAEKMSAPCADSPKHYDTSNSVLRQALIGQSTSEHSHGTNAISGQDTTSTSTTPVPTSS